MFVTKRVYEKADKNDGIDYWMKEIAPSNALRKWFAHKEERWQEFKSRYHMELKKKKELLKQLMDLEKDKKVTLLYAAKDDERNNAQALLEALETR